MSPAAAAGSLCVAGLGQVYAVAAADSRARLDEALETILLELADSAGPLPRLRRGLPRLRGNAVHLSRPEDDFEGGDRG